MTTTPNPWSNPTTWKIRATEYDGTISIQASLYLADGTDRGDAQEIKALFPKSYRVHATTLSFGNGQLIGLVAFDVTLGSTGVTGEYNEAGLKRYLSFRTKVAKLGYEVEFVDGGVSNSLTEEELNTKLEAK